MPLAAWCRLLLSTCVGAGLASRPAQAQSPRLVADLSQAVTNLSSSAGEGPTYGFEGDSLAFFVAFDPVHLHQVWRTDGTPGGTRPIGHLDSGGSFPPVDFYGVVGDRPIFRELGFLWGITPQGQGSVGSFDVLRTPVNSAQRSSAIIGLPAARLGSRLILNISGFQGTTLTNHLLATDGTPAGTVTLLPGPGLTVNRPVTWNDRVLLWRRQTGNVELLSTQGTPETTGVVRTMFPATGAASISWITPAGPLAYFFATPNSQGILNLWRTDGTDTGTVPVTSIATPNQFRTLVWDGSRLGFLAQTGLNSARLWTSDGTAPGTAQAPWPGTVFIPTNAFTSVDPEFHPTQALVALDHRLLWLGTRSGVQGLYAGDGSDAGSVSLTTAATTASEPIAVVNAAGGRVAYFMGRVGSNFQLWRTNGLPGAANTFAITNFNFTSSSAQFRAITSLQGRFIFAVQNQNTTDRWSVYITDGTAAGTTLLVRPALRELASSSPSRFEPEADNRASFTARTPDRGRERWITDGTAGGTLPCPEVVSGTSDGGEPPQYLRVGDRVFSRRWGLLLDCDGRVGSRNSLHVAPDACQPGTLLKNFSETPGFGFDFNAMAALGDTLIFAGPNQVQCSTTTTLWRSDGTPEGTTEVIPIGTPGRPLGIEGDFALFRGRLFFGAGQALWATDGTAEGTGIVRALNGSSESNAVVPNTFRVTPGAPDGGTRLFFQANLPTDQLWITDGTQDGTRVVDAAATFSSEGSATLAALGDRIVAAVSKAGSGAEIYVTNADATVLLPILDAHPTSSIASRGNLTAANTPAGTRVFFTIDDALHGVELWITDGTAPGTRMVIDLWPGLPGSSPSNLLAAGDGVYFIANSGLSGRELWFSDGTAEGTRLVADLNPGPLSSQVGNITRIGERLYFSVDAGGLGFEPWVLDLQPCPADFDADGLLTPDDLADFIAAFFAQAAGGPIDPRLDLDADGDADPDDLADFVGLYFAGC